MLIIIAMTMDSRMNDRYLKIRRLMEKPVRIVLCLPPSQVSVLDDWAIKAGMRSRTAALRALLERGLQSKRDDFTVD